MVEPSDTVAEPSSEESLQAEGAHIVDSILESDAAEQAFLADDPWEDERFLPDGRSAANPEYLMGHPRSLDDREGVTSTRQESSAGLWDDEVLQLEKELAAKLDSAEEEKEKLELLRLKKTRRKHYVESLQIQFNSLKNLKAARQEEVESLQKQVSLKQLETSHLGLEKQRTENTAKQYIERCHRDQGMKERMTKEITDLQTETDLDRELIDACITYSEKHQSEYRLLEKYCREDEEKVKDCMQRIEKLAGDEDKSKREEETMGLEMKGAKVELGRLTQQVTEATAERDAKIEQWSKIKQHAKSGDDDIRRLQEELDFLAAKTAAKNEAMQRQREFYDSELRNNAELERRLAASEVNAVKARDYVAELEKKIREIQDQIHSFNNACGTKRRAIKTTKANILELSAQINRAKADEARWRNIAKEIEEKRSEVNQKNLTDEERLVQLNKALDERETNFRIAERKIIKLRDINYGKGQENMRLKRELETMNVNVRGNSLYLGNLRTQMRNIRNSAHNQAQQIYDLQYKAAQLERRIAFMEGTDTGPSEKRMEEVKVLTARRDAISAEASMMTERILKQGDVIKNLKKEVDHQEDERKRNEIALAEAMLYMHTTERSVEKAKARRIESVAEVSSSRLKLRYIADKAENKLDTVSGMSIRHEELSGLFKERMAVVALEREQYRAQRNRVEEQRSWFAKILRELEHQQRGVKTRYELMTLPSIGAADHGQGDAKDIVQVQATFFIKAAQEKQSILNQIQSYKTAIQKVMDDNWRLRQFLDKYEQQSHDIKKNALHLKQRGDMDERLQSLDDELSFVRERLRAHESHVYGYKEELQILRKTDEKLDQLQDNLQQGTRQESAELIAAMQETDDQKVRRDRTLKQNATMLNAIRRAEDWPVVKADIESTLYTDAERLMLSTISRFLDSHPESFPSVDQLFKENAIEMSEGLTKILVRTKSASSRISLSATQSAFSSARTR